jgi:hypothetical protein
MGKLDLAEQKLRVVLQTEPENPAAGYLLGLVHEGQYRREAGQERPWTRTAAVPAGPMSSPHNSNVELHSVAAPVAVQWVFHALQAAAASAGCCG